MRSRTLGRTGIEVSVIGLGAAFVGNLHDRVDEKVGVETVVAAMNAGVTLIDTAPLYIQGLSERMVGQAMSKHPAKNVVVETKAGHLPPGFDYSYDMTMRCVSDSLERLQLDYYVPIVHIHDAPKELFGRVMGKGGALEALRKLQSEKVIGHIGTASNLPEDNTPYIESGEFEVAVVPEAYSLLNQTATERIFPAAERFDMGIVIATPFEVGLLAMGVDRYLQLPQKDAKRSFSQECLEHVRKIEALCARYGVSLAAAALQYILRHPQVTAVIPGARTPAEVRENVRAGVQRIPDEFWAELQPLIRHWEKGVHR